MQRFFKKVLAVILTLSMLLPISSAYSVSVSAESDDTYLVVNVINGGYLDDFNLTVKSTDFAYYKYSLLDDCDNYYVKDNSTLCKISSADLGSNVFNVLFDLFLENDGDFSDLFIKLLIQVNITLSSSNTDDFLYYVYITDGYKTLKSEIYTIPGNSHQEDEWTVVWNNDPCMHQYSKWTTVIEATCTEAGEKAEICPYCGEVVATETISAIGHDWADWEVADAATCVQDGTKQRVCKNDLSHIETEEIPATGHTPGDWENETPAICEESGLKVQKCTVCGEVLATEVIPALGHIDENGDGLCDRDGDPMPGADNDADNGDDNSQPSGKTFYCKWCIKYELKKYSQWEPIYAIIHAIFHFFSQLFGTGWYA